MTDPNPDTWPRFLAHHAQTTLAELVDGFTDINSRDVELVRSTLPERQPLTKLLGPIRLTVSEGHAPPRRTVLLKALTARTTIETVVNVHANPTQSHHWEVTVWPW